MCDFSALAAANAGGAAGAIGQYGTTAQIAGTIMSTGASVASAVAQRHGFEAQAQVARNNAQLEEWRARDAIRRGQAAEQSQRLKVAGLKGTQRASMAARGLDLSEGTPLDILTDTDYIGELDALTIRDNAVREAWGYRQQATNFRDNAAVLDRRAGQVSPLMAGGTTLLTGATAVADRWYRREAIRAMGARVGIGGAALPFPSVSVD